MFSCPCALASILTSSTAFICPPGGCSISSIGDQRRKTSAAEVQGFGAVIPFTNLSLKILRISISIFLGATINETLVHRLNGDDDIVHINELFIHQSIHNIHNMKK